MRHASERVTRTVEMSRCDVFPLRLALFALAALVLMLAGLDSNALAMNEQASDAKGALKESRGPYGYIDWGTMTAVAEGVGLAPPGVTNPSQAQAMAGRAAVLDARRNLLEVLQGVRIESQTLVADYITQSDLVASQVKGMLQGASIVRVTALPDGARQALISISLTGGLGGLFTNQTPTAPMIPATAEVFAGLERRVALLEAELDKSRPTPVATETRPAEEALKRRMERLERRIEEQEQSRKRLEAELVRQDKLLASTVPTTPAASFPVVTPGATIKASLTPAPAVSSRPKTAPDYTGLVVDARGLGFAPSLKPRLYAGTSKLYPGPAIDPEAARRRGMVRYFSDLSEAERSDMAGGNPLTIAAKGLHEADPGSLEIGPADADALRAMLEQRENPLDACRLVIVF